MRRKFGTIRVGRNAADGLFIPVDTAKRRKTAIVETIRVARDSSNGQFVTTARIR